MTQKENELIQLLREAPTEAIPVMADILCCYTYCGDDFQKEIDEAMRLSKEATIAVVAKWKATIPANVTV